MSTTLKVFYIFNNVKSIVEKNKNIDSLFKEHHPKFYLRQNNFIKTKCENIAMMINNKHIELKDYIIFLFDLYFYDEKLIWSNVKSKSIIELKKKYSEKELKKAQEIVLKLKKQSNIFKNSKDLYKIDEIDGSSILLELIKSNHITTYFYVKYFPKETENLNFENCNNKIKNINKSCLYLYKLLKVWKNQSIKKEIP